ncbi:MAG: hypothetical protein DI535_02610 [Citrobacter freundii]|nr:MAG: hypothetical protein DI535_02610 [Citrobacter freundii]
MKAESSYTDFEAMKQQERAAYLLAGYFQYDLNAEEEEELDKWITASDANLKLFEELTDEKRMAEYLRWYTSRDVEGRLREARKQLKPSGTPVIQRWWKYAAAAAILISAGIILYRSTVFTDDGGDSIALKEPDQALGIQSPVLKLADGNLIALDKKDTVISDGISMNSGTLVYNENRDAGSNEFIVPRKTSGRVILPDGSKVWLNAGSVIRYPASFTGSTRQVSVAGEAYFEVAKNPSKPFIVMVNGIRVQATGTAFNIKAYNNEPFVSITMTEGSVKVSSKNKTQDLRVTQQLQISDAGNWKLLQKDAMNVTAWTENKLQLTDASTEELKRSIERWYDVTVVIKEDINKHLNGTFSRDISLTALLQLLEQTNDIHFQVDGNRVTILK